MTATRYSPISIRLGAQGTMHDSPETKKGIRTESLPVRSESICSTNALGLPEYLMLTKMHPVGPHGVWGA